MPTIIIKTQAELDALPDSFKEFTVIELRGGTQYDRLIVRKACESSHVVARGNSHVVACESSHVEAWGSSHVEAWGSSHVVACGSSHVVARESSHVVACESSHVEARGSSHVEARGSSHVVACGSSHVVARGSSHVEAWGSSHVEARGSSHVVAWGSSHVVARESSHVVACGSSHVVARESSHVVACESSHVEAWGSSHVEARGSVSVHNHSNSTTIELFGFAAAWLIAKTLKITIRSATAQIITPKNKPGVEGWLENEGIETDGANVTLFKRVSAEFKTQEGKPEETVWTVGVELTHPAWNPTGEECGAGKYHACSRGYFCDEFRAIAGDRYIAIQIETKDLHAWDGGDYPHKIAFRKGTVLHECDKFGVKKS